MDEHTSHELAYQKGYEKGKQDAAPKRGFWRCFVHSALLSANGGDGDG